MATTKITNPELFDLGSLNTALKLPSGTTAERPTSPSTGEWRYNTTTNLIEFYDGAEWKELSSEEIPPVPSENFNTVLYTGNGGTQSITGVGFKPDWIAIKDRSASNSWRVFDSTRGLTSPQTLFFNLDFAEDSESNTVSSFDADGFTMGSQSGVNTNGNDYVAYCWKANGGTTSSNTDGTQTSTVQVNSKTGFSIVQWTSSAAGASETVGHGLGTTPAMIILKRTDAVEDWYIWHKDLGAGSSALNQYLRFTTASQATATNLFNTVNSTVFNPSYTNGVPNTNVAYCFAEKAGYSKFGSYTGNGSTNGPMVVTGFEPAYIMIKNSTAIYEWTVYDNKRSTSNPRDNVLYPNTSGAENSGETGDIDFLANGFQLKAAAGSINQNGGTLIYAAFASDASSAPTLTNSFNTTLYTGNGGTKLITGVGFSPSWVWAKKTSGSDDNVWFDVVRGVQKELISNSTAAEATKTAAISSFDSDGFTTGNNGALNASGSNYVGWNWKAAELPAINNDGTFTTLVSANQAAGFSIVKFSTTSPSASDVFPHGLGAAPDVIIAKTLSATTPWNIYHTSMGTGKYLEFTTSPPQTNSNYFATVDATTFQYRPSSTNQTYVALCFRSITSFSSFGSYVGNGSAGQAVNVGFTPNWVLIKSTVGNDNWRLYDTARGITAGGYLEPNTADPNNTANAPALTTTATGWEITSGGVANGDNANGNEYLYFAFKENPAQPPISSGYMEYLVVAGGGGSSADSGGGAGAGAGGLRTSYGDISGGGASAETAITLATGTYTITVGAGGAAYDGVTTSQNGVASTITGTASVSTVGGGAAGDFLKSGTAYKGNDGGSGGGSANSNGALSLTGGAGTANEGFAGGAGSTAAGPGNDGLSSGGGGGATSAGGDGALNVAGDGGFGLTSAITGSNTGYAGGGGAGCRGTSGTTAGSGNSGGGDGENSGSGNAGTANTGGGGGGGRSAGANGGSGVVILRMNTSDYSGTTTGSPTVTTVGSETILTYTGSGTYVHS